MILVVDSFYQAWAKAETVVEAKNKLRKEIGGKKLSASVRVFDVPADYWIDEMGNGHGSAKAQEICLS